MNTPTQKLGMTYAHLAARIDRDMIRLGLTQYEACIAHELARIGTSAMNAALAKMLADKSPAAPICLSRLMSGAFYAVLADWNVLQELERAGINPDAEIEAYEANLNGVNHPGGGKHV